MTTYTFYSKDKTDALLLEKVSISKNLTLNTDYTVSNVITLTNNNYTLLFVNVLYNSQTYSFSCLTLGSSDKIVAQFGNIVFKYEESSSIKVIKMTDNGTNVDLSTTGINIIGLAV